MDNWTYAEGRLPYRFDDFPRTDTVCLDGDWDFAWFAPGQALPDDPAACCKSTMPVPGNWQLHGFGRPRYINTRYTFGADGFALCPPEIPAGKGAVGFYRKTITLPALHENQRQILSVGGFSAALTVFLNGRFVCYADNGRTACETDLTDYLLPGENTLLLRVDEFSPGSYLECQDMWRLSGIFRSVELYRIHALHLSDCYVWTELEKDGAAVHLECKVHNFGKTAAPRATVQAKLYAPDGALLQSTAFQTGNDSDRFEEISMASMPLPPWVPAGARDQMLRIPGGVTATAYAKLQVTSPLLWSAESPALYTVELTHTENGIAVESTRLRVGIRSIGVSGKGELLVNGTPVKLRGVNRHEFSPENGYVVTEAEMRRDLELMKRCNVNAVRSSHYPNLPLWYRLCDEYGFYVMDEANMESHGLSYRKNILPGNDLRWLPRVLDRQGAMLQTNKNHACIFCWSLGNEIGFGETVALAAAYCKAADPTRLVHKRQMNIVADMDSETYPSPATMKQCAEKKPTRPFCTNEYLHSMGNACGSLTEYWHEIYTHDNLIGGFVWEWCDHGLLQHAADGTPYYAYGGDFGEEFHDSNFCIDGLTTPDRTFTPKLQELKKVYEPVHFEAKDVQSGLFTVENRLSFTPLSHYAGRLTLLENGVPVYSSGFSLPDTAPLCTDEFALDLTGLPQTTGEALLLLEVTLQEQTVAFAQFFYKQGQKDALCPGADVQFALTQDGLCVQTQAGLTAKIDRGTGLLCLRQNENELLRDWRLQVYRAPTDNDSRSDYVLDKTLSWHACALDALTPVCTDLNAENLTPQLVKAVCVTDYKGCACGFTVTQTLYICGTQVFCDLQVTPYGKLPVLGRMGMTGALPATFTQMCWYGKGPLETYPDRQSSGIAARYRVNVPQQYNYIKPQEFGLHEKCRSTVLSDGSLSLRCDAPLPMGMSALCHTDAQLAAAAHTCDLTPGEIMLHLDYAQLGLGNKSCGPDALPAYRLDPVPMRFGCLLTAAAGELLPGCGAQVPDGLAPYTPWAAQSPENESLQTYRDPSDPDVRAHAGMV